MEFQIITFGNGEILKGVFDAIAICLNAQSGTLYQPLIRISLILGGLWAALYAIYGDYMRAITGWILPMTVIMQLLFVPQATVWIVDPVSRYHQKVDHVPYGLAMIAGRISEFGFNITEQVEKVFSLPDDLKYQKTGHMFASTLLQQARTFRITNEDIAENMRNFVGHCVAYDALLGRKYTIEELRQSDDIWQLISTTASPVRSFLWREPKKENALRARPEIITCEEGVKRFNQQWSEILSLSAERFGKKVFGKNHYINPKAELLQHLPLAYAALTEMSQSAEKILQQNMMIYSVVDGLEHKSTQLGNAPNFAVRRAYLQQRSTYETLGAMASETLPTIKAVIEAIAYSAFLFIIPLAVLPFGYTFLKTWFQVLLWLQMWAPLYAILNFIMTMAARSKSIAALSLSNSAGVTIASSVGLANVNADIAAMAGYLSMSIPFLCIAMVKGIGSFINVPGILSSISSSAAGQMATDAVSGNYNVANIIQGTRQAYNTNLMRHDYSASYKSGSFQQTDGHVEISTSADGQQVINMSRSNLPLSLNAAETQSAQFTEQAGRSYQKGLQHSQSYAKHMADSFRHMVDLSDHLARSESSAGTFSKNQSIEKSEALNKTSQIIKDFAKENNLSTEQASQVMAAASIGGGQGFSLLGLLGVSLDAKASIAGQANLKEVYQKAEKIAQSEEFQSSVRETIQNSKNESLSDTDERGKRLTEGTTSAWDEANSERVEAAKSFSESEHYQKQAEQAKTFSSTINADHLQSALEWYSKQPMDNTKGTVGMREAARVFAQEPKLRNRILKRYFEQEGLIPSAHSEINLSSEAALRSAYEQENRQEVLEANKHSSEREMGKLKQTAKNQGIKGPEDNFLEQDFRKSQTEANNELGQAKYKGMKNYSEANAEYNQKSNENLTGLAAIEGMKHKIDFISPQKDAVKSRSDLNKDEK